MELENIKYTKVTVNQEQNEIRSTPNDGKTKVRKNFTYSRREIEAITNILSLSQRNEIKELIDRVETTTTFLWTDTRDEEKLNLSCTFSSNTITITDDYRVNTFQVGQTVTTNLDQQLTITAISNKTLTLNTTVTSGTNTVIGNRNYLVTFVEIPKIPSQVGYGNYFPQVTLKMKEL